MIKIQVTILIFYFSCCALFAQQQRQFTHFMFNKMAYNPAYTGSGDGITLTALYRNQWAGINGAPISQFFTIDAPLKQNKIGVGLNILHSTIGITNTWNLDGTYAYRLKVGTRASLAGGVMVSARYLAINFTDPSINTGQNPSPDPAISNEPYSGYIFNVGAGLYFHLPHFYIGASVPRIIESDIDFNKNSGVVSKESRHYYLMTGIGIDAGPSLEIKPQIILKYTAGAPLDADANINFLISNKILLGTSYRTGGNLGGKGESIDGILGFQITRQFYLGLSYDYTLSSLQKLQKGSFEAMMKYIIFNNNEDHLQNPRYF